HQSLRGTFAHRGVMQCRTYFKSGQPHHSPFDPLLTSATISNCAAAFRLPFYYGTQIRVLSAPSEVIDETPELYHRSRGHAGLATYHSCRAPAPTCDRLAQQHYSDRMCKSTGCISPRSAGRRFRRGQGCPHRIAGQTVITSDMVNWQQPLAR